MAGSLHVGTATRDDPGRDPIQRAGWWHCKPIHELADPSMLDELVRRALGLGERSTSAGEVRPEVVEAVPGGAIEPAVTVTEAMELYRAKIAVGELRQKSDAQKKLWHQTKERSLRYFVDVVGDLPMNEINREHAQTYFAWWNEAITPSATNPDPKSPKTAARHFGDMRDLYRRFYSYQGEEERANPFRELNFKDRRAKRKKRPAFSDDWVRSKIFDAAERTFPRALLPPLHVALPLETLRPPPLPKLVSLCTTGSANRRFMVADGEAEKDGLKDRPR